MVIFTHQVGQLLIKTMGTTDPNQDLVWSVWVEYAFATKERILDNLMAQNLANSY